MDVLPKVGLLSHSFENLFSIMGEGGVRVGDVSWMKSQRSISSIRVSLLIG